MALFNYYAVLDRDKDLDFIGDVTLNQGEHKTTQLRFVVPQEYENFNFTAEFCTPKQSYSSGILNSQVDENYGSVLVYDVENCISEKRGVVYVQLVAYHSTEGEIIFKSNKGGGCAIRVNASVNAEINSQELEDVNVKIVESTAQLNRLTEEYAQAIGETEQVTAQLLADRQNGLFQGQRGETGQRGEEGLGIFVSSCTSNNLTSTIDKSTIGLPQGRSLKEGDLIVTQEKLLFVVCQTPSAQSTQVQVNYVTLLKGEGGERGKSAYEVAVDGGYTGTEAQWLDWLKGENGQAGTNGNSVFVAYSAFADGTNFTQNWTSGQNYIGFASGQAAPIAKNDYVWSLFKGEQGEQLTTSYSLSIPVTTSDWVGDAAPYYSTQQVRGVGANDIVVVNDEVNIWAVPSSNAITFFSHTKESKNITVSITNMEKKSLLKTVVTNCTLTITKNGESISAGEVLENGDCLTIFVTPNTNYGSVSLSVNGQAFTSGNTYTVTGENAVVIASAVQTSFSVTFNGTDCTCNGANTATLLQDYACTLSAGVGFALPNTITVTVGGNALLSGVGGYSYNQGTGALTVDFSTFVDGGNIVITALGVAQPNGCIVTRDSGVTIVSGGTTITDSTFTVEEGTILNLSYYVSGWSGSITGYLYLDNVAVADNSTSGGGLTSDIEYNLVVNSNILISSSGNDCYITTS